ncbi:MAG TPA: cation-transporting P-type ATPase [Povalibacter sp.]|nr:cation-transporting P-type ATPase [Povalibacter sp.]HMN43592.1 cation-transporting P-type ATPase [Povalibacter sp.]
MTDASVSREPWHTLDANAVVERLKSDTEHGLSAAEAAARLQQYGSNRLPRARRRPAWLRLLLQFHNVLIYIMLLAAIITALLQHWIDTGVLLVAVVVNAIVGFIQEGKAESALDSIRGMLASQATVRRDGEQRSVPGDDLVPGDIVLLASGDRVPADLRVVSAKNARVDEALLTGESVAVEKNVETVAVDTSLGDRRCMLYSGSLVTTGQAVGVVIGTGVDTELGRISSMLRDVKPVTTPLVRQMADFSRWLAVAIIGIAALTFLLGTWWRGHSPADMFTMVVALVASAIPEGLPAILTVTLALGVQRMARQRAIIRHLPAVETLGSVSVICSDKTGTLTRNEMTVQRLVTAGKIYDVNGIGYAPKGSIDVGEQPVTPAEDRDLTLCCRAAILCNDATLNEDGDDWRIVGDPTEGALVVFAAKAALDAGDERSQHSRLDVIPFESEHRYMATLHAHAGGAIMFIKGAPERVLDMCSQQRVDGTDAPLDPDYWRRQAVDCAARGLRLLSIACKTLPADEPRIPEGAVDGGCTLLGLFGIIDPPREEAIEAVATCHGAGVSVKMITGDHVETARAIGAALGIGKGEPALTGAEIESLDDQALRAVVHDIDIYARTSPEHKLRLVKALQYNRAVVAMTGDGVNDAPALKRADIGVAMGRKGTDAAKEAAAMVLTDDNFATIGNAIREGRGVYDNIRKFVLFMLPTNGGEALVVIISILFDLPLPLTPAQVLWINLVTSSTLGVALAFEPTESNVMQRAPRDPGAGLLDRLLAWRVAVVSLLMMAATLTLFLWQLHLGAGIDSARTMAVNAVVACEIFYLLSSRSIHGSMVHSRVLSGNRYVPLTIVACIILQIIYTYTPPMQHVFATAALGLAEWAMVIAAGAVLFLAVEIDKSLQNRKRRKRKAENTPSVDNSNRVTA